MSLGLHTLKNAASEYDNTLVRSDFKQLEGGFTYRRPAVVFCIDCLLTNKPSIANEAGPYERSFHQ